MNTFDDDDYALQVMDEEGLWPDDDVDYEDSDDDDIEFLVDALWYPPMHMRTDLVSYTYLHRGHTFSLSYFPNKM